MAAFQAFPMKVGDHGCVPGTFDSSVGRAEDCRCYKRPSLGRWFKSGSKDVWFFLAKRCEDKLTADFACVFGQQETEDFPDRESNPGRGGESAES